MSPTRILAFATLFVVFLLVALTGGWIRHDASNGHASLRESEQRGPASLESKLQQSVLVDIWGSRRPAIDFWRADTRAVVFVFMQPQCPVVNLDLPRVIELEKQLRAEGVQFLGIYSCDGETLNSMAAHAHDRDIPFPVLKDDRNALADVLEAERTSEAVVVDDLFVKRYQGLFDDQYRAGGRKGGASHNYLEHALAQILSGDAVDTPKTLSTGCLIERWNPRRQFKPVTFSKDVAPIIQEKCQSCHRPGQVGPFPLLNYEDARSHASMIEEVVLDRRMPPWHAVTDETKFGPFSNDRRLTQEEIDTIEAWVETGVAKGDPADLPPPREWPSEWQIGTPDVVISMDEEFDVPAQGQLPYLYFPIKTGFQEDRWVQAAEVKPGDASVVHHVSVHVTRPGRRPFGLLGVLQLYGTSGERARVAANYTPGESVKIFPDNFGMLIPKGSTLTFEVHYTPNGRATKDRSRVGLVFAKQPPRYEVKAHAFTRNGFRIPPNDSDYSVENELEFDRDIRILNLKPHMHVRGKSWRYELVRPDGRAETLLTVPRWDFEWQSIYEFEHPVLVPAGTTIRAVACWDNSINNPNNPDPSAEVRFGLQSEDEMMLGWVTYFEEPPKDIDRGKFNDGNDE
jgi:hypothetical protein